LHFKCNLQRSAPGAAATPAAAAGKGKGALADGDKRLVVGAVQVRVVALQVAFERQTLKPVFQLIGYRLWV
jgi:hypothetical protein